MRRGKRSSEATYGNEGADKYSVHEEIAGLREARGLALQATAVLVYCASLVEEAGEEHCSTHKSTDPAQCPSSAS